MKLKESYSDGRISRREIERAVDALQELLDEMDNAGVDSVSCSPNTYRLSRFLGTSSGYIDLTNIYQYTEEFYDEDEEDEEEE